MCVSQPGRSQVTGRKEPCMVTRFCVAEFMSFILKPFFVWLFSFVVPKLQPAFVLWALRLVQIFCPHCYMQHLDLSFDFISALHEFDELLGPTAASIMLCYVRKNKLEVHRKNAFQKSELTDQMGKLNIKYQSFLKVFTKTRRILAYHLGITVLIIRGIRTKWSLIRRSVIIRVINKIAGVRFV